MDEETTVEFAHFVGKQFTLTAVDTSRKFPDSYNTEDATSLAFTLDSITYVAVENPSDGYRSSLDRVLVLGTVEKMETEFRPHTVVARHSDKYECGHADLIELMDIETGKVVIRFGTNNDDDYYPSFVGFYDPTALAANQEGAQHAG